MKTSILLPVFLLIASMLLTGCATHHQASRHGPPTCLPPPLSLAEIKEMTARGVSDETILDTLRASHANYQLNPEDIAGLQQASVSQMVIDYLLKTPEFSKSEPAISCASSCSYARPPFWVWHGGYGFGFNSIPGGHH